jgi:hypothetical protein
LVCVVGGEEAREFVVESLGCKVLGCRRVFFL